MVLSRQWAANITITAEDVDYLLNLLLEREVPMSSRELALALVEQKLQFEADLLQEKYQDVLVYNPSHHYETGQRVVFPALENAVATVQSVRPGNNPQYGEFSVIDVQFDTATADAPQREFAAALASAHKLSQAEVPNLGGLSQLTAEDVLELDDLDLVSELEQQLIESHSLAYVGKKWFPRDLLLEVNEGHLHLTEAVLDMVGGGPLTTDEILEQIGKIDNSSMALQAFSMNYALKDDNRFDEVGPAGQVLWYLTRLEPKDALEVPAPLRYTPIDYDVNALTDEMLDLEAEIADELSTHLKRSKSEAKRTAEASFTLTYPHRRAGTLPLNLYTKQLFPTARRAPRIYITLVDGQDGEEYVGWVVQRDHYVSGLAAFYEKHKVPIGGTVTLRRGETPDKMIVDIAAYRPRSEYIRLAVPKGDQLAFEDQKRAIGCDFDDLMIIGLDDLEAFDQFVRQTNQYRKSISAILKMLLPALGKLTPQGTAHVRTIYSAVNVLRRCPPGVIMATLNTNPDFENVGGHYWRLSDH